MLAEIGLCDVMGARGWEIESENFCELRIGEILR